MGAGRWIAPDFGQRLVKVAERQFLRGRELDRPDIPRCPVVVRFCPGHGHWGGRDLARVRVGPQLDRLRRESEAEVVGAVVHLVGRDGKHAVGLSKGEGAISRAEQAAVAAHTVRRVVRRVIDHRDVSARLGLQPGEAAHVGPHVLGGVLVAAKGLRLGVDDDPAHGVTRLPLELPHRRDHQLDVLGLAEIDGAAGDRERKTARPRVLASGRQATFNQGRALRREVEHAGLLDPPAVPGETRGDVAGGVTDAE